MNANELERKVEQVTALNADAQRVYDEASQPGIAHDQLEQAIEHLERLRDKAVELLGPHGGDAIEPLAREAADLATDAVQAAAELFGAAVANGPGSESWAKAKAAGSAATPEFRDLVNAALLGRMREAERVEDHPTAQHWREASHALGLVPVAVVELDAKGSMRLVRVDRHNGDSIYKIMDEWVMKFASFNLLDVRTKWFEVTGRRVAIHA